MANRQQEYRNPQDRQRRSSNERYWENGDDERQWGSERERERGYGQHSGSEEYDEGRVQFGRRRDTSEESGSTGRAAGYGGYGDFGQGDYDRPGRQANTGQGRYGQSGYGQGRYDTGYGGGNYGQPNYSQGQPNYGAGSDYGYGRSGRHEGGRGDSEEGRFGYGGSGLRGSGAGYGSGQWYEPYGEGQQYGSERWGGEYGRQFGRGQYGGGQQYGSGQAGPGQYRSGQYGAGQYGGSRHGPGEGPHRGKGPKGYQRSDERIKEMICERLREDPDIDASEVTLTVQGGKVTLEGTVDHRDTKNAIEDVAEQLGVSEVQNNLRIQRAGQQGMEQSGKTSMGASSKTALGSEDGETSKQKRN